MESGWLDAKGWRDAERAFLCPLFCPLVSFRLPMLKGECGGKAAASFARFVDHAIFRITVCSFCA